MPVSLDRDLILYKICQKNSIYPSISNNNIPTCFQSLRLDQKKTEIGKTNIILQSYVNNKKVRWW